MDGGAFAAEVLRLQIKKSKINKLIKELNYQLAIIERKFTDNANKLNKIYDCFTYSAYDHSEGTMITYFEETVELRQEKFNLIVDSLKNWIEAMQKQEKDARKLLVRTEDELNVANANLAAFIKAQFDKEQGE